MAHIQQGREISTVGPSLLKLRYYTVLVAKRRKKSQNEAFESGKYFHLFNGGIDRRIIFNSKEDFDRFEAYLYLLNSAESPRVSNLFAGNREHEIYETGRGDRLVALAAYSITPQDFNMLATPVALNGIARFMQKVQTAYTMYFNYKYQRDGRIFHSSYKSVPAESHDHLKYLFSYVHLNPAQMFDKYWDTSENTALSTHILNALKYRYSSVKEFESRKYIITDPDKFPAYLRKAKDARSYLQFWAKKTTGTLQTKKSLVS